MVRHTVSYFPHWKTIFDKNQKFGNEYGLHALYVMRDIDQINDTTIVLEAENLDKAKEFMTSSLFKEAMKQAGVLTDPEITYLADATASH
jgi:hypothetical protein